MKFIRCAKGVKTMANEIIKLIEYITNSNVTKGIAIIYCVFALIVFALAISVFVFVFKQFKRMSK